MNFFRRQLGGSDKPSRRAGGPTWGVVHPPGATRAAHGALSYSQLSARGHGPATDCRWSSPLRGAFGRQEGLVSIAPQTDRFGARAGVHLELSYDESA